MALYASEHTRFINELLKKHPEWVEDQKRGRALWWDKPQDIEANEQAAADRLPQKPYPYDVNF